MAYPVKTPQKGLSAESVIINEWFLEEGDRVEKGDEVLSVETNKAVIDVVAECEGTILKIFFEEGEEVPVLTNVAVIGETGEDFSEFYPEELEKQEKEEIDNIEDSNQVVTDEEDEEEEEEEEEKIEYQFVDENIIKISPRAEKLAVKHNIDYEKLTASGPEGRIIVRDIEAELNKKEAVGINKVIEGEYKEIELTNMRKTIADNMFNSLSTTAQLTLNSSFDASAILNYRKKVKSNIDKLDLENITINDLILYAVSRTLLDFKEINAYMLEDKIRLYDKVHLGVAVHTEKGLMVPTLFDAGNKTLNTISRESNELANQCKEGSIEPEYLEGATFTVTNLGALGIESFSPILNPPQVGILGVGTIEYKIKKENDEFLKYPAMNLSLTFDHRAVDGAPAAEFLKKLRVNLEHIELILSI